MNQRTSNKLSRVQILRFLAAASVVLSHALGTSSTYFGERSYLSFFRHGDLGVDVFFVISGFVIGLSVLKGPIEWHEFLSRRLTRIVPLYWVVTLFTALLLAIGLSRTAMPDVGYLFCSLSYSCLITGQMPIVYPGWSLEYEMFFYLLVAMALALRLDILRTVLPVLSGLVLAGFVMKPSQVESPAMAFLTDPITLEFGLGVLVAYFFNNKRPATILLMMIAVMLVISALWGSDRTFRLCAVGIPSALLVYVAALLDRQKPLCDPERNLLVWLGDASYSIYLAQAVVISGTVKMMLKLLPGMPQDVVILSGFAATLAVAALLHLFVDQPLENLCRKFLRRPRKAPDRADMVGSRPEASSSASRGMDGH